MNTSDFLKTFEEFLGRHGWPADQSPWSIVEQWESLVDQAKAGYNWGFYEYTNELGVRDLLAEAFADERLSRYDQINGMRQRVEDADVRLQQTLLPEVEIGGVDKPWWRRGILATAGDEYVDDVKRLFAIELPLSSFSAPDELQAWLSRHNASLAIGGYQVELAESPPGRDKRSVSLTIASSRRIGQLVIWDTGEAELSMGDVGSGTVVEEHREITSTIGLRDATETLVAWISDSG